MINPMAILIPSLAIIVISGCSIATTLSHLRVNRSKTALVEELERQIKAQRGLIEAKNSELEAYRGLIAGQNNLIDELRKRVDILVQYNPLNVHRD